MSHLIMLAPANYGSALAQLGKQRLSRIKSWFEGVEPGQGVLDWLELGSYYSVYYPSSNDKDGEEYAQKNGLPNHGAWLKDFAISARFDVTESWTLKAEGHFFDGSAVILNKYNPAPEQKWSMLALKASFGF